MVNTNETVFGGENTLSLLKSKRIGDTLTPEEFNAIIYLLKRNTSFKENIDIHNNEINGDYGTYVLNLDSATITDQGVVITNETLSNLGSVRLVNPLFENSKYTLFLTVVHNPSVNIGLYDINENIEVSELSIELKKDTDVIIPFNKFDRNYIVKFSGLVVVSHDVPEIS